MDPNPPTEPPVDVSHPEEPVDVRQRVGDEQPSRPEIMLAQLRTELHPALDVLRHIGDESFGSLFLAREASLRRDVVIKVLRPHFVDNEEARLRFERESRTAARISHSNVVPVFRVDRLANGVPFFVEPYLGDCTLRDKQASIGRFQPREVRKVLLQLSAALNAAHRTGIVHRDVRPGTVRCEGESERLLLTDFGIAGVLESAGLDEETITYPGEVLGSAGYMSPEQAAGNDVTERSDIYSLGVLGWRLLAGEKARVPKVGKNMDRSVMLSVAPDDPDLIDLIERCLRVSPDDRPSAESIVRELEAWDSRYGAGGGGTWAGLWERRIPQITTLMLAAMGALGFLLDLVASESRWFWIAIIVLGAVFAGGLVVAWFHGKKGRQAVTWLEIGLLAGLAVVTVTACVLAWRLTAP